jgi:FGGY family of carbohydrate kinases, C-terminal domain
MLGLGSGLRQIILAGRKQGARIDSIVLSGGGGRHPLVRQLLADCAGFGNALGSALRRTPKCGLFRWFAGHEKLEDRLCDWDTLQSKGAKSTCSFGGDG